jgi:hypothetical protein
MDWKGPSQDDMLLFDALMGAHHIELAARSGYLWAGYCQKRSKAWHHQQHDHSIAIDVMLYHKNSLSGCFYREMTALKKRVKMIPLIRM